ncbi:MAG: hypothetical protein GXO35_07460 [Gammaproteobacteria bacterium]|nr:hypothetical protein [Gammaproteobacteria bacterium]
MKTKTIALGAVLSALLSTQVFAMPQMAGTNSTEAGKRIIERDGALAKVGTLQLCVDYHELTTDAARKSYIQELDLRSQLSEQDHVLSPKHKVSNSMTMCGMYMSKGKPIVEKSRQIRPLTFKTVHVYEDLYITTQSGMITAIHERKEGTMPPALTPELPKVQAPPIAPK